MANRLWDSKRTALMNALKKLRIDQDVTQKGLADRLGKPQSFVSKFEAGERKLDFIEVLDVCEALKTNPQTLIELYENLLGSSGNAR